MSVFDHFGGTPSTNAVMLPLVILTMVVERFFMTTEEDGVRMSLQLLGLTGVVGLCVYLLLCWKAIGNWVLVFPETHFLTVAAFVLLGRYSGYRLTELWRFRDLAIAPEPVAAGPRTTPPTADVSPAQGPEKIGISQIEPQDGGSRVKT
jgi:hypothetical protein